jgi:drug/metabolite transporter (DMT)-like permease
MTEIVTSVAVIRASNTRGVAYVVLSIFFYAATDALAKFLAPSLPVIELIFIRNALTLLIVFAMFWKFRKGVFLTSRLGLHLVRAVLATLAMLLFFLSFQIMPLADAIAVGSTAPVILVILTALFLNDKVRRPQWIAIAVSFLSALVIVRPSSGAVTLQALMPLTAAAALAGFMFTTRVLKDESRFSLLLFPPALAIVATSLPMPWIWITPDMPQWVYLSLFGVLGIGALYFRSLGYASVNPAFVAPIEYSNLLWAGIFGFTIFGDLPSMSLLFGSAIIMSCNLYVMVTGRRHAN